MLLVLPDDARLSPEKDAERTLDEAALLLALEWWPGGMGFGACIFISRLSTDVEDEEKRRERADQAEQESRWEDTEMSDEVPLGVAADRQKSSSSARHSAAAIVSRAHPLAPETAAARAEIQSKIDSPSPVRALGLDRAESIGLGPAFALQERAPGSPLSQVVTVDVPAGGFPSSPLSPRTKRQASPTELVKEDAKGMPRLLKRPSIKRRARTPSEEEDVDDVDDDEAGAGGMKMGSLMLSSPPPPSGSR